jgi:hypothetical protein
MLEVKPDQVEPYFPDHFGKPRSRNTVHPYHSHEFARSQLLEYSAFNHWPPS